MEVLIKGTNIDLTPEMKIYLNDKFKPISKYNKKINEIRVEIEQDTKHLKGEVIRCEANVNYNGNLIRVEKNAVSFEKAVNKVKDHLKLVLSKERKKSIDKYRK